MTYKKRIIYACDFETTVFEGQTDTQVWSSAICPVRTKAQQMGKRRKPAPYDDEVIVHHSIDETYKWLIHNHEECIMYYHNLKFDGSFWLDFLMRNGWKYVHAEYTKEYKKKKYTFVNEKSIEAYEPPSYTFETCISDIGQWYFIKLHFEGFTVELKDSLKLLPMDLRTLGKSFGVKHQKLEMKYAGNRFPGCEINSEEMHYIKNDVLCLAECLEKMIAEGHTKLTIGACCMNEYKTSIGKTAYNEMFPNLQEITAPTGEDADTYIRKAYKGGWCYAKPDKCGKIQKGGCTADVNSLYPSVMSSESGNRYPVGVPHWFKGKIPQEVESDKSRYYFVRIRCAFRLKDNFLPFIQIKGSLYYKGTEMLTDSRPKIKGVKYSEFTEAITGERITDVVELTLTCTDFELLKKHYDIYDLQILDGCWFYTDIGIFDTYIDKWKQVKMNSKGAERQIAKLFLNNLYGKLATSTNSSYKRPVFDSSGNIKMQTVIEEKKKPVYIAAGAAVTSYARNFTVTAAQLNYKYFCYADTDSIHCSCKPDQLKGVPIHPTAFCHWKIETCWNAGWFVRQKTYIEHVTEEDQTPIESPYNNIKCAGLPEECKAVLDKALTETKEEAHHNAQMYKVYEIVKDNPLCKLTYADGWKYKFLSHRKTYKDVKSGLQIYGKLVPVRIKGGILLKEGFYTMK